MVQERVHNGTMYNAVVYHYFHILPDLRLRRILALETRLFDLFTEQDGGVIIRTPQKLGNRRLRLEVFLELPGPPARQRKLGDVMLSSPAPGSPFEIEERHPLDPRYSDLLITAAEDDEAKFLREGYGFYY